MRKKAFTLIELLVVISILALLASIILVAMGSAREKGIYAKSLYFSETAHHALGDEDVGSWEFNEGSGTGVGDSSSYESSGTWNGTGSHWGNHDSSPLETALRGYGSFNGTDDYVSIPYSDEMDGGTDMTMELWFNASSLDSLGGCLIGKDNSYGILVLDGGDPSYLRLIVFFRGSPGVGSLIVTNFGVNVGAGNVLGKWHHLLVTVGSEGGNSRRMIIYLDSKELYNFSFTSTVTIRKDNTDLNIGACPELNRYFHGSIDQVRIYKKYLHE